jgi:phospholipid/cholesterol/gamma-HCH transport system substrate-binding protein
MRPGHRKRFPNHVIGLILVVIIAVGAVLAYNKKLPWSHGFEIRAVFHTAQNVRVKSPVRIAGVNVGEVTGVEHETSDDPAYQAAVNAGQVPKGLPSGQQAAVVTMEINAEGLPLHEDAQLQLRPRLFLEGNLFVDLKPGSPESPDISDGYVFPMGQTSTSVQLDQILTTLQSNVRKNLQVFLQEFGDALIKYGGAKGFQELYRTSPGAYKYTSQVNQAFMGTNQHDLSGLVKNLDSTVRALDKNEPALQDLITNLRVVTGSFASDTASLEQAVRVLPGVLDEAHPAFVALNDSFPPLRAFAREALPGTRTTPETLDAATPFLHQVRKLVSKQELRGVVHDLRPTIPDLAKLTNRSVPFLHQSRALASCFNEVIIPWSNNQVQPMGPLYDFQPVGNVYQETGYGLEGIAGESRSGDANGEFVRVEGGGGANSITPILPGATGQIVTSNLEDQGQTFGFAEDTINGSMPGYNDSVKTPFRPDVACETQEPPNLQAHQGPAPPQTPVSSLAPSPVKSSTADKAYAEQWTKSEQLGQQGDQQKANAVIGRALQQWQRSTGNDSSGGAK